MDRDPASLCARSYDLLVVGGGIHGAALARAATRQGLAVALIEQGDFGGATSANSQKVIHGGMRYLQQLDLARLRESVTARRRLLTIAPHWVRPLPLTVATRGRGVFSRPVMGTALCLYTLLSMDRNRGVVADRRLPRDRLLSRTRYRDTGPELADPNASGGVCWHDAMAVNTERLTLGFVQAAVEQGAAAANYLRAESLLESNGTVFGARVRDALDNSEYEIRARTTVLTAGPWTDRLLGRPGPDASARWCKGVNLVLGRELVSGSGMGFVVPDPGRDREALVDKGGRMYFVVPWRGRNIVGTFYAPHPGGPADCQVSENDVAAVLGELNRALKQTDPVRRDEVVWAHAGLLPLSANSTPGMTLAKRQQLIGDRKGLVAVVGVKYTTAQIVADQVLRRIMPRLGRSWSRLPEAPLPGGEHWSATANADVSPHLLEQYGTRYPGFLDGAGPGWLEPVIDSDPTLRGEVIYAVRREMARRLEDVVLRRCLIGSRGHPGTAAIDTCADIMAQELGWERAQRDAQVSAVQAGYGIFRP